MTHGRMTKWLALALLACSLAPAEESRSIPELVVPDAAEPPLPDGAFRRFGSLAFRHGGVGPTEFSPSGPFFSPDGDTVYVPGSSSLMAFDAATGRPRFHYLYRGLNITVCDEGEPGVRIDFHQGPLAGQFVVLEHGKGTELHRGKQTVVENGTVYATFAGGSRVLAAFAKPFDPRSAIGWKTNAVLYDVPRKAVLAELGAGGSYRDSVLSADRRRLAFRSQDMQLRVFDTADGRLLRSVPLGLREGYDDASFPTWSRDGKTAYSWRRHNKALEIVSLDIDSGAIRVLARDDRQVVYSSPVVSPDGGYLAYQRNDHFREHNNYWRLLRLSDLTEAHIVDVRPAATKAAFSPDGRSFWLLSNCGLARFDLETGKLDPLSTDPLSPTQSLAFSRDGTRLHAVAGAQLITWDVATGREIRTRAGFDDYYRTQAHLRCIHVSHEGRRTIWAGHSRVHSVLDGRKVATFYAANAHRHCEFDLTPDHRHIVHDAYYGELKLGDLWNGKTLRELLPKAPVRETYRMAIGPDNRTLALVHRDHRQDGDATEVDVELWDIQQNRRTGSLRRVGGLDGDVPMEFSQDSRELRISHRGQLSVWNVEDGTLVRRRATRQGAYVFQSLPNRHWQLSYSYRQGGLRQLELVDVHTGEVGRTWNYPDGEITATAFSPDHVTMAVATPAVPAALYRIYEPPPQSPPLHNSSEMQLIESLGRNQAAEAFAAICELIRRGDACVPGLRAALTRKPLSPEAVRELIERLDSPAFATREEATRQLLAADERIVPALQAARDEGGSLEKLARIKHVLAQFRSDDVPKNRRTAYRAVEVLAAIHTSAARELLTQLANGDDGATASHEARATLARWTSEATTPLP